MIAVGWLDNKAVHFVSTADTTSMTSVKRRVGNKKEDMPTPDSVKNYNKYMGGKDRHDRLCSTFSLGKRHKFKKNYVNQCCCCHQLHHSKLKKYNEVLLRCASMSQYGLLRDRQLLHNIM
jgi:hypothetical protein